MAGGPVEANSEGVSQGLLELLDPGVDLVVEDDQDDEGPDDHEEQVHPEDVDLEWMFPRIRSGLLGTASSQDNLV